MNVKLKKADKKKILLLKKTKVNNKIQINIFLLVKQKIAKKYYLNSQIEEKDDKLLFDYKIYLKNKIQKGIKKLSKYKYKKKRRRKCRIIFTLDKEYLH